MINIYLFIASHNNILKYQEACNKYNPEPTLVYLKCS